MVWKLLKAEKNVSLLSLLLLLISRYRRLISDLSRTTGLVWRHSPKHIWVASLAVRVFQLFNKLKYGSIKRESCTHLGVWRDNLAQFTGNIHQFTFMACMGRFNFPNIRGLFCSLNIMSSIVHTDTWAISFVRFNSSEDLICLQV